MNHWKCIRYSYKTIAIKAFVCLFLLAFVHEVRSQKVQFEAIPSEYGLSQNLISALFQDSQGFIWVGTKNGLNRFDGYEFKSFLHNPFDSTTISDNYIHSIFEDSKNQLWIGTSLGLNKFDRETEQFHSVITQNVGSNAIPLQKMAVTCIKEYATNQLWLGTYRNGVVLLDMNQEKESIVQLFQSDQTPKTINRNQVVDIIQHDQSKIWVCHKEYLSTIQKMGKGSFSVKSHRWEDLLSEPQWAPKKIRDYPFKNATNIRADANTFALIEGSESLWLKTLDGIGKWEPSTQKFIFQSIDFDRSSYENSPFLGTGSVGLEDKDGQLWIGGSWNIVKYNPVDLSIEYSLRNEFDRLGSAFRINCKSILEDASGTIWVGDNGRGLYKYSPAKNLFYNSEHTSPLFERSTRTIFEDSKGSIWFTDNSRLFHWDRKNGKDPYPIILDIGKWPRLSKDQFSNVFSILEDKENNLWVGCKYRLFQLIMERGKIVDFKLYNFEDTEETIFDLHEDAAGDIWMISNAAFGKFNKQSAQFERNYFKREGGSKNELQGSSSIYQAKNGTFWLGSSYGLLRFDKNVKSFTYFENDPFNVKSISHNNVKTICPDPLTPEKVLWIGTGGGGINRFDIEEEEFYHFKVKDGLADNYVYGILSDEANNLWISTNQGLSRYNPTSEVFDNYYTSDGLKDNEFNTGAYFKSPSTEMFFGGIKGFSSFYPSNIVKSPFNPEIVFTDLLVANKIIDFKEDQYFIDKPINENEAIHLDYDDKIFSIKFASLDYTNPGKNRFQYKLENFDQDWQLIGNKREATFTNIDPGDYVFKVKGSNFSGLWNEQSKDINIKIAFPWWQTWTAYICYFILLSLLIYLVHTFQVNRHLATSEAKKYKEITLLKNKLYTNITHEFRTPLTVISGLVKQLSDSSISDQLSNPQKEAFKKNTSVILRNAKNLLNLVNQMLDLTKLDGGKMEVNYTKGNIVPFIHYLTESFQNLAKEKGIQLTFYPEIDDIVMDFDEEKMERILYNLLSNAIKFTHQGGKVFVHVDKEMKDDEEVLMIKVKDSGIGIAEKDIDNVFTRFFQIEDEDSTHVGGTGVGLALTKDIVELLNGSIHLTSKKGVGSTFALLLPISKKASASPKNYQREANGKSDEVEQTNIVLPSQPSINLMDKPVLLIVEDNLDIKDYLYQILKSEYQCVFASNGQEGVEKAIELIPDVIISDVKMPIKTGYQLVQEIKNDARTSHIPIIILTAKTKQEDKLEGLKSGADVYLTKPFNKEELFVRLERLIKLRKELQAKYKGDEGTADILEMNAEDIFINKVKKHVLENLDKSTFDSEALARLLNMSSSQLYRKLKAITGNTPNNFIRQHRFSVAIEYLTTTQLNISEISYKVGFNDPNYFSRVFNQEFGKSPSHYRR